MQKPNKQHTVRLGCLIVAAILFVFLIGSLVWWIVPFKSKFEFCMLDDGTYAATGYNGKFPHVIYPSSYQGVPVSHIVYATLGNSDLKSVTVPNSVTVIEGSAFASGEKLETVRLPEGLLKIGDGAFYNCPVLTEITIPETVTSIGTGAFEGCTALREIHIPAQVSSISEHLQITARNEIYGDNFDRTEISAFADCTALESITVDEGNPYYCVVEGVLYTKDMTKLLCYPAAKKGESFTVPESVTEIDDGAFSGCIHLKEIILPEHLSEIRGYTFRNCTALQKLSIPETVQSIGKYAFENCETLDLNAFPEGVDGIAEGVLSNSGTTKFSISEDITEIGSMAFYNCDHLQEIVLPASTQKIGDRALTGCRALQGIEISAENPHYTTLDGVLFNKDCTELLYYPPAKADVRHYRVPETVKKVDDNAFTCCRLTSILFPSDMERVDAETGETNSISVLSSDTLEVLTVPDTFKNSLIWIGSENVKAIYSYSTGRAHSGGNMHEKLHHLVLDGGSFSENWPEELTLTKEGYTFVGWSDTGLDHASDAEPLPDTPGIYYAVFTPNEE